MGKKPATNQLAAKQFGGARRGMTLVEILVVITIIGVLVALLIPTIGAVMRRSRSSVIAVELQELQRAIEAYKNKVGDYPPDFTNRLAIQNHITNAYPRNTRNINAWLNINLNANPVPPNTPAMLDPAEALVFWLSMTRKNVRDPLGGNGAAEEYFKFDKTRLKDIDGDGWMEYYSKYGTGAPYVYFDGRKISVPNPVGPGTLPTYAYAWAIYPSPYTNQSTSLAPNVPERKTAGQTNGIPTLGSLPAIGMVRPYRSELPVPNTEIETWQDLPNSSRTQWMDPGKFQIISAGLNSLFGGPEPTTWFKSYPGRNYYSNNADLSDDDDNIASFSELKTLENAVP